MKEEPAVVGIHLFNPRNMAGSEELEDRMSKELVPYFRDAPGVIEVSILKGLRGAPKDAPPPIGAMILFESQEALQKWWKALPAEEQKWEAEEIEKYKDIAVIHNDFLAIKGQ